MASRSASGIDPVAAGSVVAARGLTAGYGTVPVIRELDLHVDAGEVVALLGVNGAGKTTVVRALAGQIPAMQGEVWFRGRPTTAPLHRLARDGLRLITQ